MSKILDRSFKDLRRGNRNLNDCLDCTIFIFLASNDNF